MWVKPQTLRLFSRFLHCTKDVMNSLSMCQRVTPYTLRSCISAVSTLFIVTARGLFSRATNPHMMDALCVCLVSSLLAPSLLHGRGPWLPYGLQGPRRCDPMPSLPTSTPSISYWRKKRQFSETWRGRYLANINDKVRAKQVWTQFMATGLSPVGRL